MCACLCVCVHISIFKGFGAAGSNFYFWNEVSEENPALTLLWFFNGLHQHRSRSLKVSHMGECWSPKQRHLMVFIYIYVCMCIRLILCLSSTCALDELSEQLWFQVNQHFPVKCSFYPLTRSASLCYFCLFYSMLFCVTSPYKIMVLYNCTACIRMVWVSVLFVTMEINSVNGN